MRIIWVFFFVSMFVGSAGAEDLRNCDDQPIAALPACLQENITILSRRLVEITAKVGSGETSREATDALIKSMASQLSSLTTKLDELQKNLKTAVITFCTGEYTPSDCGGPRYDPRDWPDVNKIGQRECSAHMKNFNVTVVKNREHSGGCCGYGYYTATCTGY